MHDTDENPAPYGWAFEELKEAMLLLDPSLQPVFMDWLVALNRPESKVPKELSRQTGVEIEQSEVAELRRAVFAGWRTQGADEPLEVYAKRAYESVDAELKLHHLGRGMEIGDMKCQLAKLMPHVRRALAAWPGRENSGDAGGPTECNAHG